MQFCADRQPLVPPGAVHLMARDMTVTVSADVTLGQLDTELAKAGQWLPVDASPDRTLGQLVLRNTTGPLRLAYGAWRDLLMGCQFRSGDGELVSPGGRVVKNVAGYDLTKFLVGSFGCFGEPVTFTSRTYRRPDKALHVVLPPDNTPVATLLTTPMRPHYALRNCEHLLLGYLGDADTIAYYRDEAAKLSPRSTKVVSLADDQAMRADAWRHAADADCFRASLPPAKLDAFFKRYPATDVAACAAFGVVVGKTNDASALARLVADHDGTVVSFGAAGQPLGLDFPETLLKLLRRLKANLDPTSRLPPLPVVSA